eukprot:306859-Amphidinium_carterae.1
MLEGATVSYNPSYGHVLSGSLTPTFQYTVRTLEILELTHVHMLKRKAKQRSPKWTRNAY